MYSLRSIVATAAIFVSCVRADYVIDPDSVSLSQRTSWCQSEISTCPLICQQYPPGGTEVNTCDPESLTYGCLCDNGQQPNVSEYSLTLPYFTCTEWGNQCVKACGQDNGCASACRQDHPCGALNPTKANTTSSTTSSATGTATATESNTIYTGLAGSNSGSDDSSAAFRAADSNGAFGFLLLAGSVCLGVFLL
ncbi:hypothetical protein F5X96DRAFT_682144 [Biscogniauxia mediterranea]|nr:hypothetical protein F5X96DRAFT_682144 [Biscogniauxia mediterranea]